MTRQQLEHILRASGAICGAGEIVVAGSQSIVGVVSDAPEELRESVEADVFTLRDPQDAQLIDGSIGEDSPFHRTFGYYAHGIGKETCVLPDGWEGRLIRLVTAGTNGVVGLCLEPHDMAISKLVAGREKDLEFVGTMLRLGIVNPQRLRERLAATPVGEELRTLISHRVTRLATRSS
jgi:hypothetical protein